MIKFTSENAKSLYANYISNNINMPDKCIICGGDLEINESGIIKCINPQCPKKIEHLIANALDILNIKGAGPAFIEKAAKVCSNLFTFLSLLDEKAVEWAGGINGDKIKEQIWAALKKAIPIYKYLALFDINGFGERKLEQIKSSIKIENSKIILNKNSILETFGWADDGYNRLNIALNSESLQEDIKNCLAFIKFDNSFNEALILKNSNKKLAGLSFCFTGKADAIGTRKDCQTLVEFYGGKVLSSITQNLSYLVSDNLNSTSSKSIKAQKFGVKVISSQQLLDMIHN